MKAYVTEKYGPPAKTLHLNEVEKPAPNDDQLLIKVHAVSVNAYDWHMWTADIFLVRLMGGGMFRPSDPTPGADVAGRVEAVGADVTRFKPGDAVYGDIGKGGFAEYAVSREKNLALKPANLTFEQAAAVPMAALTALQGLRDHGQLQHGEQVLVYGASGGVGTFAIQFGRHLGGCVTAVTSTRNLEQARALGAEHVIDYTKEDFSTSGKQYNLIYAANGFRPLSAYRRALAPGGRCVVAGGKLRQLMQAMLLGSRMSRSENKKMLNYIAKVDPADLELIKELIEAGEIVPVIDRVYPFSQAPDALAYLGAGHARGKVVITLTPYDKAAA